MDILIYSTTQVSRRAETEEGLLKPQDKSFHVVFHVGFCLILQHSNHTTSPKMVAYIENVPNWLSFKIST